jgi:hypothetical protein
MSDNLNTKLDAIFDARAQRVAEARRVRLETEKKQEENLKAFLVLQTSVIRPTLEDLAKNLTDRGLECAVFETVDGQQKGSETLAAGNGIEFYRHVIFKTIRKGESPHLTLMLDKATGRVLFHFSTASMDQKGETGVSTVVNLDAVTADLINEEALKVIAIVCK